MFSQINQLRANLAAVSNGAYSIAALSSALATLPTSLAIAAQLYNIDSQEPVIQGCPPESPDCR